MVDPAVIPVFYCLFMFNCFGEKYEKDLLFKASRGTRSIEFNLKDVCSIYTGPEDGLSSKMNGFSALCNHGMKPAKKFVQNPVKALKMDVNTIVFENADPAMSSIVCSYFRPKSVVYSSFDLGPEEPCGDLKYVTITGGKGFDINMLKNARGIYIEHSQMSTKSVAIAREDFNFENVLFFEEKFPNLRSITVKKSNVVSIVLKEKGFLTDSPLGTIDFSENSITNIDYLVHDTVQPLVEQLYLNDNKLSTLPKKFLEAYPRLKILHLYNNKFEVFPYNYDHFQRFFHINECLFFISPINDIETENTLFFMDNMKEWIPNIKKENINSVGLKDSFVDGVSYKCSSKFDDEPVQFPESWTDLIGLLERGITCPPWDSHPDRLIRKPESEDMFYLPDTGQETILMGRTYDLERLEGPFGVESEVFPGAIFPVVLLKLPYAVPELYKIQLFRSILISEFDKEHHKETFVIFSMELSSGKWETENFEWVAQFAYNIPNVIGFSPVFIKDDADPYEPIQGVKPCRITNDQLMSIIDQGVGMYHKFFESVGAIEEAPIWKYLRIFRIDYRRLSWIELLLDESHMKNCVGQLGNDDKYKIVLSSRIDVIDIALDFQNDNQLDIDVRTLSEYLAKQKLPPGITIFTTVRYPPSRSEHPLDLERIKEISNKLKPITKHIFFGYK